MWIAGFTINMMTLMALSLVIGILIDDAVVVRENIFRHMEHGEDPMTAAQRGTAEIGLAVMATTFTILAVFLPVGFMTGHRRPVLQVVRADDCVRGGDVAARRVHARPDAVVALRAVHSAGGTDADAHRPAVRADGAAPTTRSTAAITACWRGAAQPVEDARRSPPSSSSPASSATTVMGTEFVPAEDRGEFQVIVELPPGTSFDESVATIARSKRELLAIPEVTPGFSTVGVNGQVRASNLRVKTTKKEARERASARSRRRSARMLADDAVRRRRRWRTPSSCRARRTSRRSTCSCAATTSTTLQRDHERDPGQGPPDPGRRGREEQSRSGQPEVVARINRDLAADLGFSVGSIASQLRGMVEGIVPTRLRDGDREHDIRVRLAPEFRNDPAAVLRTPLYSPAGAGGPRRRRRRVRAGGRAEQHRPRAAAAGRPRSASTSRRATRSDDVTAEVEKVMAAVPMPANFEWGFAGDVEMMQESAAAMGLAMILAVAFIYIVLASQFESFLEPFIIMLSLPLAIVGALLLLLVTGNNLGMPAMIGVVMLMGLVTKNAILLVDYTNQLRGEGLNVKDALLKAGPVRLRPIVMTTVAMMLGMTALRLRRRRRQRVPRADLDCDDRRPDHVDAADAGRRPGGVPAARARHGPGDVACAARPMPPALRAAARVTTAC